MKIDRQKNRINNKNDPYYFYNNEIKILLKDYFIGKVNKNLKCLDFGCGEKPFDSYFSEIGLNKNRICLTQFM